MGIQNFEKGAFDSIKGLEQIDDLILVDQSPIGKSLPIELSHLYQGLQRDPGSLRPHPGG